MYKRTTLVLTAALWVAFANFGYLGDPLVRAQARRPIASSVFRNVREFGAKGDGKTLDTAAINRAIEATAASGGGTVYFPAGTYLSFSIRLKSNITIYLDNGAT